MLSGSRPRQLSCNAVTVFLHPRVRPESEPVVPVKRCDDETPSGTQPSSPLPVTYKHDWKPGVSCLLLVNVYGGDEVRGEMENLFLKGQEKQLLLLRSSSCYHDEWQKTKLRLSSVAL